MHNTPGHRILSLLCAEHQKQQQTLTLKTNKETKKPFSCLKALKVYGSLLENSVTLLRERSVKLNNIDATKYQLK